MRNQVLSSFPVSGPCTADLQGLKLGGGKVGTEKPRHDSHVAIGSNESNNFGAFEH